jgi:hypothetical protein
VLSAHRSNRNRATTRQFQYIAKDLYGFLDTLFVVKIVSVAKVRYKLFRAV